jgi:hypothetical protein
MGKIEPEPGIVAFLSRGKRTAVLVLDEAPDGRWKCLNLDGDEAGKVALRYPHAFDEATEEPGRED